MSFDPSVADGRLSECTQAAADRAVTRCIDLVGAGIGVIVLSPLLLGLGLAVRLTSPGAAIFRSTRVGRRGRPFTLYKFRSMIADADLQGPAVTAANDARVTRMGQILRRSKLDELPQLLNVLRGDMSLVGPRPESPAYVAQYSREQLAILEAKPGMTSPASLEFRDEEALLTGEAWNEYYIHQVMPAKLTIDLEYLRRRTPCSDLRLVVETARRLIDRDA